VFPGKDYGAIEGLMLNGCGSLCRVSLIYYKVPGMV
jgi:hypothetical protein